MIRKNKLIRINLIFLCFLAQIGFSQSYTKISMGEARKAIHKWHFINIKCESSGKPKQKIFDQALETLESDFSFYKDKISTSQSSLKKLGSKEIKSYQEKNFFYLVTINCKESKIEGIDLSHGTKVFDQSLNGTRSLTRNLIHQISNALYKRAYGKKSIFQQKIAFAASAKTSLANTSKELYIMDFDGKNSKKLTNHGGVVLSPAFSPDNSRILYSVIYRGKVKLYEIDLRTLNKRVISQKKGINSGAVYAPDGKGIYLTLSYTGNTEINYMDLKTKSLRKVTNHFSVDVDPSINKDGTLMSFLSSRAKKAMIYTLDPSGTEKNVKRVSFVGKFNATPRFSPDGKEIVFSSWMNNTFDIFRIYANGQSLVRLTRNFGSNEDPSYSPEGEFIAFSSKRVISRMKADQNIYIMNRNGAAVRKLTSDLGQCSAPRFSN